MATQETSVQVPKRDIRRVESLEDVLEAVKVKQLVNPDARMTINYNNREMEIDLNREGVLVLQGVILTPALEKAIGKVIESSSAVIEVHPCILH